jgi:iron complex outermembrane receptor protein
LLPAALAGSPCTNLGTVNSDGTISPKRTKDSGVTYRFNATWKIDPDRLVYATWSKGFRPGGINRRATIRPYDTDFLTNYEFGFKTSWADRRFRLNGAFFLQDWKSFQYSFLGLNSFTEIHNGPDARIKGVEMDFGWTPVDGLTLAGSAAYTDAKIRKQLCAFDDLTFTCAPDTNPDPDGAPNYVAAPKGTRLPITPRFKINGTARYEVPVGAAKAHIQGVVAHQSSAASDLRTLFINALGQEANPAAGTGRLKSYTTFDFAIGADWRLFSAELYIENAFDERAQLSRVIECGQCFQRPYIVTNTPRTIGLRAGYKF